MIIDLTSSPAGVITLEPSQVTLSNSTESIPVVIRPTAVGSKLVRMTAQPGFAVPSTPLLINVIP